MSPDLKTGPDASVTTLVSGILRDAQELVKQQFELFKREIQNDMRKAKEAAVTLGSGMCLGVVGVLLLGEMMVHLLASLFPLVPLWGWYGICGIAFCMVAGCLVCASKRKIDSIQRLPDESAQALKENVQWIANRP
jgi:hypothetical protein